MQQEFLEDTLLRIPSFDQTMLCCIPGWCGRGLLRSWLVAFVLWRPFVWGVGGADVVVLGGGAAVVCCCRRRCWCVSSLGLIDALVCRGLVAWVWGEVGRYDQVRFCFSSFLWSLFPALFWHGFVLVLGVGLWWDGVGVLCAFRVSFDRCLLFSFCSRWLCVRFSFTFCWTSSMFIFYGIDQMLALYPLLLGSQKQAYIPWFVTLLAHVLCLCWLHNTVVPMCNGAEKKERQQLSTENIKLSKTVIPETQVLTLKVAGHWPRKSRHTLSGGTVNWSGLQHLILLDVNFRHTTHL